MSKRNWILYHDIPIEREREIPILERERDCTNSTYRLVYKFITLKYEILYNSITYLPMDSKTCAVLRASR